MLAMPNMGQSPFFQVFSRKVPRVNPQGTLGTEKPGLMRATTPKSVNNIEIDLKEF